MASTLPTLSKTWSFVQNQTVTSVGTVEGDTNNLMLLLINQLITWGWTVVGSGSTAYGSGANDGTNRITTTANFSASCWITLSNSTMGCSLQIQKSTTPNWIWRGSYAGFTGGSPSATVAGTAADSFNANSSGGGGAAAPFGASAFATTCKWHGWKSSDNYVHEIVVYIASNPGFHLRIEKAVNAPAGFPAAVFAINDAGGSGSNKMILGSLIWTMWYSSARQQMYYMTVAILGGMFIQSMVVSGFDNNYMIAPIGVAWTTAPVLGMGFWNADLYVVASSLTEGATFPSSGPRTWVVCGDLLLPWTDVAMQIT